MTPIPFEKTKLAKTFGPAEQVKKPKSVTLRVGQNVGKSEEFTPLFKQLMECMKREQF